MIGNKGNINLPHINGVTDSEKITQIIRFLHQLVEHLNWSAGSSDASGMSFSVRKENGTETVHIHMKQGVDTYTVSFSPTEIQYSKNDPV